MRDAVVHIVPWSRVAALLALSALAGACDRDRDAPVQGGAIVDAPPAPDTAHALDSAIKDAGEDLVIPDLPAPEGWHRWPHAPDDVAIFVPDDISTVQGLQWEPCPFQPVGCEMAQAPWEKEYGWAFGAGMVVAQTSSGAVMEFSRPAPNEHVDVVLVRGSAVLAAWRMHIPNSRGVVFPMPEQDGTVTAALTRFQKENAPRAYIGPAETIMQAPERVEVFGPPDAALIPTDFTNRSDRLLVWKEFYERFTVRDLQTGATFRPEGKSDWKVNSATAVRDAVVYWRLKWGQHGSIRLWTTDGNSRPLLEDDTYSYDMPATDGNVLVWYRSTDQIGMNQFKNVELWVSPLGEDLTKLEPKRLVDVPDTWIHDPSVGEGWVAVRYTFTDVRLYRLSDGHERRLPVVEGTSWLGRGQTGGLRFAGGKVWTTARRNNYTGIGGVSHIVRFDIDSLESY